MYKKEGSKDSRNALLRKSGYLQGAQEQGAGTKDLVAVLVEVVAAEGGRATTA